MNALRRLRRVRRDDRGSLALAMLIAIVGTGIGVLLVPIVVVQTHTTTFTDSRAREMNAAEAGTAVALGLVRAATNATGGGVAAELPCTTERPITGTVAGSAGGLTYRVRLAYYVDGNPLGQNDAWLATYAGPGSSGHGMICSTGAGTYYPKTQDNVPKYVLITATGSDARGSRTLRSIYNVKASNANVAGGSIYVYPAGSTYYCMDAGSAQPIAGQPVRLRACVPQPGGSQHLIAQQAWSYNADLSIELVSSVTSTYPNGLCLSALYSKGDRKSVGDAITLQPCARLGSAPWTQMWSVDNNAHLEGSTSDKSAINGLCIQADHQADGTALLLAGCDGGTTDTEQTWVPSPDAGAGGAGAGNDQVVNFEQFGRCLDVTKATVTGHPGGEDFLIAYTCKQDPNPANVLWNQKFSQQGATWVTTYNGTPYCLSSPKRAYAYSRSGAGPYVTVAPCRGADPSTIDWTRFGATDAHGNLLPIDQRYTIQDATGLCLSLNSNSADFLDGQYSKVIVAACDGSTVQKWNAQPDVAVPALTDLSEIATPTS